MAFFASNATLAAFAALPLVAAVVLAFGVLNYKVFGGKPNASIHRPRADPDDPR